MNAAIITLDPDQQGTNTRKTGPACCYITLDPDQQATLYQTNRASMLLYNTGFD